MTSVNDSKPTKGPEPSKSTEKNSPNNDENWGYDLYPERKGAKYKPTWTRRIFGMEGKEELDKIKCERNVYSCVVKHPLIKLLMKSLSSSGCPFDIRRHISCEVCDVSVTGGYDPLTNQIVVCQNTARSENKVGGVMAHEMIHMFDWCVNDLDFKNLDHLACTEIRAANLVHCSFMSAWMEGTASPINIRQTHRECVKMKAFMSVIAARNVTKEEATAAVDRVFPKCYDDLEPVGRRLRRNSGDMQRAYAEGPMYGYGT
ncbi:mitochondrial inner membrane protease ATP23 homolog [Diprion similis]|uniref:mitochondrial inner membrane protease ATP23 homolog n=1 Tax=Diprion similis TaxID=362088 RepID=UPI001EF993FC|nr:mitochondrial inner membrane protease ATP23 homolog [Diprion similis]